MEKNISNAGSNEYGAWIEYTDGCAIKWVESLNRTYFTDYSGNVTWVYGRQGI